MPSRPRLAHPLKPRDHARLVTPDDATEVWSYSSGNGYTSAAVSGGNGWATGVSTRRSCTVHVTINDGRVSRISYLGPTGGLLTGGEQCAFAVQNCTQ
jgi:hypothetical protein